MFWLCFSSNKLPIDPSSVLKTVEELASVPAVAAAVPAVAAAAAAVDSVVAAVSSAVAGSDVSAAPDVASSLSGAAAALVAVVAEVPDDLPDLSLLPSTIQSDGLNLRSLESVVVPAAVSALESAIAASSQAAQ